MVDWGGGKAEAGAILESAKGKVVYEGWKVRAIEIARRDEGDGAEGRYPG